jgi:hypothetical protein
MHQSANASEDDLATLAKRGVVFPVRCGKCWLRLDRWRLVPSHTWEPEDSPVIGIQTEGPASRRQDQRRRRADVPWDDVLIASGAARRTTYACRKRCGARYPLRAGTMLRLVQKAARRGDREIVLGVTY